MTSGTVQTFRNPKSDHTINQCDVFKNIEFIEYAIELNDTIEVSKIVFPYVVVLTQSCDLLQDYNAKKNQENNKSQDKFLISVIVAPLYNFEEFRVGEHLSQLDRKMENQGNIKKSRCEMIMKNENKRYHFIRFPASFPIVDSVIDFKHYFSVTVEYLQNNYDKLYVCSISPLFRELISQRFSNFLSRIGLPDPEEES